MRRSTFFFVVIVLVFNFLISVPPIDCDGRVPLDYSEVLRIQSILSLLYTIVIGVVSLAIGVAFGYFGFRLYYSLRIISKVGRHNKRRHYHSQIFVIALVCASAFILHCVFIFLLIVVQNIIFSFVGLVLTEIAPAIYMLSIMRRLSGHPSSSSKSEKSSNSKAVNSLGMSRSASPSSKSNEIRLEDLEVTNVTAEEANRTAAEDDDDEM